MYTFFPAAVLIPLGGGVRDGLSGACVEHNFMPLCAFEEKKREELQAYNPILSASCLGRNTMACTGIIPFHQDVSTRRR